MSEFQCSVQRRVAVDRLSDRVPQCHRRPFKLQVRRLTDLLCAQPEGSPPGSPCAAHSDGGGHHQYLISPAGSVCRQLVLTLQLIVKLFGKTGFLFAYSMAWAGEHLSELSDKRPLAPPRSSSYP